jgi:hypothetical protein
MQVLLEYVATYKWKVHKKKIEIIYPVKFSTGPDYQFYV